MTSKHVRLCLLDFLNHATSVPQRKSEIAFQSRSQLIWQARNTTNHAILSVHEWWKLGRPLIVRMERLKKSAKQVSVIKNHDFGRWCFVSQLSLVKLWKKAEISQYGHMWLLHNGQILLAWADDHFGWAAMTSANQAAAGVKLIMGLALRTKNMSRFCIEIYLRRFIGAKVKIWYQYFGSWQAAQCRSVCHLRQSFSQLQLPFACAYY